MFVSFFFFFQAEDGIRDVAVTGVQTCALPISREIACTRSSVSRWVIAIQVPPTFERNAAGRPACRSVVVKKSWVRVPLVMAGTRRRTSRGYLGFVCQ